MIPQEDIDYELNARFDDIHERYASSRPDPQLEYECWLEDCRLEWESLTDKQRAEIIASPTRKQEDLFPFNDDLPF